jgi:hypothetical protein
MVAPGGNPPSLAGCAIAPDDNIAIAKPIAARLWLSMRRILVIVRFLSGGCFLPLRHGVDYKASTFLVARSVFLLSAAT